MHHGAIEVAAYQETLLLMAVFGITILTMVWAGFRRWLEYREKLGRLIAEQTAARSAQYGAQMERVEEQLKTIERIVSNADVRTTARIEASMSAVGAPISSQDRLPTQP